MTKRLTHEDLLQLMTKQARLCVSLYMPAHRSLPEVAQDPIRFKNLRENVKLSAGDFKFVKRPGVEIIDR